MNAARPSRLGRYEVVSAVATGGMATIYLGRYADPGGRMRPVAIKVIKNELGRNEQYVAMFRDEAAIQLCMSHPNIVATLEADVSDGRGWIAMELLLGRSLADVCDACEARGTFVPHALAAWIAARVAGALHYAHELKDADGSRLSIIHRDANPSNIFLTYDGGVKLIDFGLAKAARRGAKTQEGIIKGKVPYLSPEQLRLSAVDARTDVYALGSSLWEMTTGRRLWKRDNDAATIRAIQAGVVPDPTELVPGYPEELWAIVWESLMPQHAHRTRDAATMAADLDRVVSRTADPAAMPLQASRFLEDLFPGERERREGWLARQLAT